MPLPLKSKPGLTGASALSIPKEWDSAWFRGFINNLLKGADVRNAVGTNGVTVSGTIASPYATISFGGPATIVGPITINPPASGTGSSLTVNGAPGQEGAVFQGGAGGDAIEVLGSPVSGQSFGEFIAAGTTAADYALRVRNQASTVDFFVLRGNGQGTLGPNGSLGLSWNAAGNMVIGSPTVGNALTVTGNNSSANLLINGSNPEGLRIATTAAGGSFIQLFNSATFMGYIGDASQEFVGGTFGDLGIGCATASKITFGIFTAKSFSINGVSTTGAQTATFLATNKPGTGASGPIAWIPVQTGGGVQGYIPIFGA